MAELEADKKLKQALEILLLMQDDPRLENYDNYRDCWNGALLAAHMRIRCLLDPYSLFNGKEPIWPNLLWPK